MHHGSDKVQVRFLRDEVAKNRLIDGAVHLLFVFNASALYFRNGARGHLPHPTLEALISVIGFPE